MNDREWTERIRKLLPLDIEAAVSEIVGFSNYAKEYDGAETFLLELARYPDSNVKGISILGLGHLARVHGKTSTQAVEVVRIALNNPDSYVAGHADSAADDIEQFTKNRVRQNDL